MDTIKEIVNGRVASMVADGTIQAKIEEGVQKAIETAISEQFRSYGSITKQISKAIEDGLRIDVSDVPFESYNEQMLVIVKNKLGDMFKGQAAERFISEMDKILEPAPAEIHIRDLVEKVVSFWKTDEPWDADYLDEEATVEVEPWEYGSSPNDVTLRMWKKAREAAILRGESRKKTPDMEAFIFGGVIRINHRHRYNPTCFREHEAFIFKLYAAGTKVSGIDGFDPEDCDLQLKACEY